MKDNYQKDLFSKQVVVLIVMISLASVLVFRLFDLQIRQGSYYRNLADDNRFYTFPIDAYRGVFLDRYQDPLVWNVVSYYQLDDPEALYSSKKSISKDEALQLISSDSAMVDKSYLRYYLYPESTAHILGYVSKINRDDLDRDSSLPLHKQIGRSGLEAVYQDQLAGQDGQVVYEINAMGERQRVIKQESPIAGQNLQTTIDPYLSQISLQSLAGRRGAVIIEDASNGEILSMVSSPTFDINILSNQWSDIDKERSRRSVVQNWFNDQNLPFFNRAIAGIYPPGSVFKLITALAGLESGEVDQTTTVVDEGVLEVGDYKYGNWYFRQYGKVEGEIGLQRSIARSNDIFFYKVAEWVGPDLIAQMAKQFGFGQKVDMPLGPQGSGLVPDPEWKEQTMGERWYLGNTYHYGIGQGDLLVTPIQVNQMGQILANRGTVCKPKLLKEEQAECYEVGVQESNINQVLAGMIDACSSGGTAYPFFTYNEAYLNPANSATENIKNGTVACKTGTAEFGGADERGYRKTHAWFVSIVEPKINMEQESSSTFTGDQIEKSLQGEDFVLKQNEPFEEVALRQQWLDKIQTQGFPERLVITVLIESDEGKEFKEGSEDAAPVAKDILDWMTGN